MNDLIDVLPYLTRDVIRYTPKKANRQSRLVPSNCLRDEIAVHAWHLVSENNLVHSYRAQQTQSFASRRGS